MEVVMKRYCVCFNLGFGFEVDAEDENDAEEYFRNVLAQTDFDSFVLECVENNTYTFDDDVIVIDAE
jgi:hypothetical protein